MIEISHDKNKPENNEQLARKNISDYLTFTAISALISSYWGSDLLKYLQVRQMFAVAAVLPVFSFIAGIFTLENHNAEVIVHPRASLIS